MQMRPDVQIQSILKSMSDVVLPAIDPDNKLAQEQARLCMGLIGLMARQLPLQFEYDCDELARLIRFANDLCAVDSPVEPSRATAEALGTSAREAAAVLACARATPEQVYQEVRALRVATGRVVTALCHDGESAARARVQQRVLAMSREQLLRERAWVISQGWEPDPRAVPNIESLLAEAPMATARVEP